MSQWANIRNVNSHVVNDYVESKKRQLWKWILKPETWNLEIVEVSIKHLNDFQV